MKGTKPDFHGAMAGEEAKVLYDQFLENLAAEYRSMQSKLKGETNKSCHVFPGAFG